MTYVEILILQAITLDQPFSVGYTDPLVHARIHMLEPASKHPSSAYTCLNLQSKHPSSAYTCLNLQSKHPSSAYTCLNLQANTHQVHTCLNLQANTHQVHTLSCEGKKCTAVDAMQNCPTVFTQHSAKPHIHTHHVQMQSKQKHTLSSTDAKHTDTHTITCSCKAHRHTTRSHSSNKELQIVYQHFNSNRTKNPDVTKKCLTKDA